MNIFLKFLNVLIGLINISIFCLTISIIKWFNLSQTTIYSVVIIWLPQYAHSVGFDIIFYLYSWKGVVVSVVLNTITSWYLITDENIYYFTPTMAILSASSHALEYIISTKDHKLKYQIMSTINVTRTIPKHIIAILYLIVLIPTVSVFGLTIVNDNIQIRDIIFWSFQIVSTTPPLILISHFQVEAEKAKQTYGNVHLLIFFIVHHIPLIISSSGTTFYTSFTLIISLVISYFFADLSENNIEAEEIVIMRKNKKDGKLIKVDTKDNNVSKVCGETFMRLYHLFTEALFSTFTWYFIMLVSAIIIIFNLDQPWVKSTYQFPSDIKQTALDIHNDVLYVNSNVLPLLQNEKVRGLLYPIVPFFNSILIGFDKIMLKMVLLEKVNNGITEIHYILADPILLIVVLALSLPGFFVLINAFPLNRIVIHQNNIWHSVQLLGFFSIVILAIGPIDIGRILGMITKGSYSYTYQTMGILLFIISVFIIISCHYIIKQNQESSDLVYRALTEDKVTTTKQKNDHVRDLRVAKGFDKFSVATSSFVFNPSFILFLISISMFVAYFKLSSASPDIQVTKKKSQLYPDYYNSPDVHLLQMEGSLLSKLPNSIVNVIWLATAVNSIIGDQCIGVGSASVCISDIVGTISSWVRDGINAVITTTIDNIHISLPNITDCDICKDAFNTLAQLDDKLPNINLAVSIDVFPSLDYANPIGTISWLPILLIISVIIIFLLLILAFFTTKFNNIKIYIDKAIISIIISILVKVSQTYSAYITSPIIVSVNSFSYSLFLFGGIMFFFGSIALLISEFYTNEVQVDQANLDKDDIDLANDEHDGSEEKQRINKLDRRKDSFIADMPDDNNDQDSV